MKKIMLLIALSLLLGQSAFAEEISSAPTVQMSSSEMESSELSVPIKDEGHKEGNAAQETTTLAPAPKKVKASSEANFSLGGMTWQRVKEDNSEANIGVAYQSQGRVVFTWQYYDISKKIWVTMNENTTSNWINFQAPHAGQYLIHVYATNELGETKDYVIGWNVVTEFITLKGMTWQALDGLGEKANIGVSYKSNSQAIFTWQYYDIARKEWQIIAKDTTSNWITFDAPRTGQYLIHVEAKTQGGVTETYTIGWKVASENVTLKGMTWQTLEKDGSRANIGISYTTNTQVTFTWQYYDISKKEWHTIASNTGANWITTKLPHRGQYLIHVEAKTKGGVTATYFMGWGVTAKPTYFSQLDSRWSWVKFNNSTIGPSGCVPTSLAMILNGSYDMPVSPADVARRMDVYSGWDFGASGKDIIVTAEVYGRTVEQVNSQSRASELLKSGFSLIMLEDVGIGHAVVVFGYDNGRTEVLDPFGRQFYNGWYALSSLWATPSKDSMDWDAGRPVFAIK